MNSGVEGTDNLPNGVTRYLLILPIAVTLFLITYFLFYLPGNISRDESIDKSGSLASGKAAFKKGDFAEAIAELEPVTKNKPYDPEALRYLGLSYEATGELAKAVPAYEASLDADNNQPEILYNLAGILDQAGKTERAIGLMERAVGLNENFMAAKIFLGDLYLKRGDRERARQEYQEVVDRKPFGNVFDQAKAKLETFDD